LQTEIVHNPDFGLLRVRFDQLGEEISAEAGAMLARDADVQMRTNMQGGLGGALRRKMLGGESLFQNTFTATAAGQSVWIAPAPEGAIEMFRLEPGMELFLQSGAYLASTAGVVLDTKWQGAKGFFSGGLFLLRAYGHGQVWFATYGGVHTVDIGSQYPGYLCDNSHMVAFTGGLQYGVRKLGGLKSLFLSGEGVVCEFSGHGRLWMQTRNPASLAAFLHPFRAVSGGG
jgi:uncharacterized protein (TIGR00266 family)